VGTYLEWFRLRDDDNCWLCGCGGRRIAHTQEHLFRHCSQWKDQEKTLCKEVGKATGWIAGRCQHVQVSELLSMEKCDKAVMDFLIATDNGKFPPKSADEEEEE